MMSWSASAEGSSQRSQAALARAEGGCLQVPLWKCDHLTLLQAQKAPPGRAEAGRAPHSVCLWIMQSLLVLSKVEDFAHPFLYARHSEAVSVPLCLCSQAGGLCSGKSCTIVRPFPGAHLCHSPLSRLGFVEGVAFSAVPWDSVVVDLLSTQPHCLGLKLLDKLLLAVCPWSDSCSLVLPSPSALVLRCHLLFFIWQMALGIISTTNPGVSGRAPEPFCFLACSLFE